jgi:hypothetical protein
LDMSRMPGGVSGGDVPIDVPVDVPGGVPVDAPGGGAADFANGASSPRKDFSEPSTCGRFSTLL